MSAKKVVIIGAGVAGANACKVAVGIGARVSILDIQPETAFARMKKRNRGAEAGVPLDYLITLRKGYQDLINEAERGLLPWAHAVRVCRIPWDPDTINPEQWDAVASTVKDACRSLG